MSLDVWKRKKKVLATTAAFLCVCVSVSALVWVVYGDTNLYNDMGMTEGLHCEGGL